MSYCMLLGMKPGALKKSTVLSAAHVFSIPSFLSFFFNNVSSPRRPRSLEGLFSYCALIHLQVRESA